MFNYYLILFFPNSTTTQLIIRKNKEQKYAQVHAVPSNYGINLNMKIDKMSNRWLPIEHSKNCGICTDKVNKQASK